MTLQLRIIYYMTVKTTCCFGKTTELTVMKTVHCKRKSKMKKKKLAEHPDIF